MSKRLCVVMAFTLSLLLSCASSYDVYRHNLVQGKQRMRYGEFHEAQTYFMKASEAERLPEALAFAATASYKINDMEGAERFITEAEKWDGRGFSQLRIAGYKALIYLREGKKNEGMEALQEYTSMYSHLYPLTTIEEVRAMIKTDKVDPEKLEVLLDQQITWYEDEVEQFQKTRTGYYGGWE